MKGKGRGNGDVSYADNMDSELSKPFEQKETWGPWCRRDHVLYYSLLPGQSNQLLRRSCDGAEASPSPLWLCL